MRISVIVPARNEEATISGTVRALLAAASRVGRGHDVEILVVDNASDDATAAAVRSFEPTGLVRLVPCADLGAARARNAGAREASGAAFVFVDADTVAPESALARVAAHVEAGVEAGIARLAALDGGLRAWCWWTFWENVRRLPLAHAKAMPAFMFCTRSAFAEFGPFDETVQIAEEWPILAGLWRARPARFVHDRAMTARSSSRRMELQSFGYARTFAKYVWAILHRSGRRRFTDRVRGCAGRVAVVGRARLFAARIVAGTRRHELRAVEIDGRRWIAKRRRRRCAPLLPAWNAWLAVSGEPVRVLAGAAWRGRERAAYQAVHGASVVAAERGGILVPVLPGTRADHVLRDASPDAAAADRIVVAAMEAMWSVHGASVTDAAGARRALTHGDAALRNVLFDSGTGVARWIDFETSHDAAESPAVGRADDLWTLARSLVAALGPASARRVADVAAEACLDAATRGALRDLAADPRRSTSVLALARAPLTGDGLAALRGAVAASDAEFP